MDCVFCRILSGEIPTNVVYEDENVLAILDISQATKGHTLIVAKQHYKNLYDIDENVAADIFRVIPKLANALKNAFHPIGLNVLINTEKPLQTVFHFHVHLIPRYPHDGVEIDFINNYGNTSKEQFLAIRDAIRAQIQ